MTRQIMDLCEFEYSAEEDCGVAPVRVLTLPVEPPGFPTDYPGVTQLRHAQDLINDHLIANTACARQYRATWRLRGATLHLWDLQGLYRLEAGAISARWLSTTINVPWGPRTPMQDDGRNFMHEGDLYLRFNSGIASSLRLFDNRGVTFRDWLARHNELCSGQRLCDLDVLERPALLSADDPESIAAIIPGIARRCAEEIALRGRVPTSNDALRASEEARRRFEEEAVTSVMQKKS